MSDVIAVSDKRVGPIGTGKTLYNGFGDTLNYGTSKTAAADGTLTVGQSVSIVANPVYIWSDTESLVTVLVTADPDSYVEEGSHVLDVKDYGAIGNGSTDDTAAIQAALDAATVAGATVYFPPGTYQVVEIYVDSNVRLLGAGAGISIIKAEGTAASPLIQVGLAANRQGDNVTIEHLTFDVNDRTNSLGLHTDPQTAPTVGLTIRHCHFKNGLNNLVRIPYWSEDTLIENNTFENADAFAVSMYGVAAGVQTRVRVINNIFYDQKGGGIQCYTDNGTFGADTQRFQDVEISGNLITDVVGAASIPIEPTGCLNLVCSNNIAIGGNNGISLGQNRNVVCEGNIILDQTNYAFEMNAGYNTLIQGNTAIDCFEFVEQSNSLGDVEGLTINNNFVSGTGRSSTVANTWFIKLNRPSGTGTTKNVQITNNTFLEPDYLVGAILLGSSATTPCDDALVSGNTFFSSGANATVPRVESSGKRITISENTFTVTRDLVSGDEYIPFVSLPSGSTYSDTVIKDNVMEFAGTSSAAANSAHINSGNVGTTGVRPGLVIKGNTMRGGEAGIRLRMVSADYRIENNDMSTCLVPFHAGSSPKPQDLAPTHISTIPIGAVAYASLGTDTIVAASDRIYIAPIYLPQDKLLTGAAVLNGTTVGTDKWCYYLTRAEGTVDAQTAAAGVLTSGADAFQQIAFTSTYYARQGTYWLCVQGNGSTDKLRTVAASTYLMFTGLKTAAAAFGAETTITPPTTFTAGQGPIAYVY